MHKEHHDYLERKHLLGLIEKELERKERLAKQQKEMLDAERKKSSFKALDRDHERYVLEHGSDHLKKREAEQI